MHLEVLVGELEEQFGVELLRQQGQYLHLLDVLELRLPLPGVLQVALNAHREVHVHLVVLEVPAEVPELLRLLLVQAPQLRQAARDAADHVGEAHQGEDHHADREDTLRHVVRDNLHRCGRELRDGPVHRRSVLVVPGCVNHVVDAQPAVVTIPVVADVEPGTTDEVANDQQQHDHYHDIRRDAHGDRVDHLLQLLPQLPQLRHARQPHETHEPEGPEELYAAAPGGGIARRPPRVPGAKAEDRERPVRQQHHQVHPEPTLEVIHEDLLEVHDDR
mmetsp:Transcript_57657/g.149850  ORF Transcript_57657/g.149850 Transcript_57657/m.149850 type:complete len:275 (-) Transcript_57657:461-1285(-)